MGGWRVQCSETVGDQRTLGTRVAKSGVRARLAPKWDYGSRAKDRSAEGLHRLSTIGDDSESEVYGA